MKYENRMFTLEFGIKKIKIRRPTDDFVASIVNESYAKFLPPKIIKYEQRQQQQNHYYQNVVSIFAFAAFY